MLRLPSIRHPLPRCRQLKFLLVDALVLGGVVFFGSADEYVRLACGRKVKKGINVYFSSDKDPYRAEQYSLKLVYSF